MTKVTYTPEFKKEFKRLSKKFKSLDEEIRDLISLLSQNPETERAWVQYLQNPVRSKKVRAKAKAEE